MKEKIYIIFKNNEEEYDDYSDWIIEIYKDKEKAENRFVELVKTNQYKKDRAIKSAKYNEDIGAYRIEEHEIENETSEAMSEKEKKTVEYLRKGLESDNKRSDFYKIDATRMEITLNLIESLQKENEELKNKNKTLEELLQGTLYEMYKYYRDLANSYQGNCISKEKVKDKIGDLADTVNKINDEIVEELKSKDICQEYLEDKRKELGLINRDIKTLQSLLEESEDSKDGEN